MVKTAAKTCMIMLVVFGLTPYGSCQETAPAEGIGTPGAASIVGNRGEMSGSTGEKKAETERDPFWPVGYTPSVAGSQASAVDGAVETSGAEPDSNAQEGLDTSGLSEEEQAVIKSHVRVGGILVQRGECIAIINGQLVLQGDDLSVLTGKKLYRFMIRSLTPDRIVLESVNEQVTETG